MRNCSLLIFLPMLVTACGNEPGPSGETFRFDESLTTESREVREVIYSMYLPTDMTDVFQRSGTNFDPALPAPVDEITLYGDMEQVAVMLGVYGVDITYMKLMEQALPLAQYYRAIETLSAKAGIPGDIFEKSARQLEQHFENKDSIGLVIEQIYRETEAFHRENGRENLAALSLAGGWVEAMYIGVQIYNADRGNTYLAEKLLQQKFSLNSVYTVLSNHQESLRVKEILLMLKKIRKIFDQIEIRYEKEGFDVDTSEKKIRTYKAHIQYDEQTMDRLIQVVSLVRAEMISVKQEPLFIP